MSGRPAVDRAGEVQAAAPLRQNRIQSDQIITALKDGDELAAAAIIGSLPLGDKKAAVTAAVKALLEVLRAPRPPLQPSVQPDFGPPSSQPPAPQIPGTPIFPGPTLNLPYPFN